MKKLIAVILALVFMLSLSACGAEEPASDLEYVKENGKLVVGITDFAPMDYEDENGEWIGFDADMAKEFAEYLGVEVEFIVIDWDNKIFELENKSIDVVWNGMTLTDKVKEDSVKLYDMLISSGLVCEVINAIPEAEYHEVVCGVEDSINAIYAYRNSVMGILDTIGQDYSNLSFDATEIQKKIGDPENMALLKQVLTKLG